MFSFLSLCIFVDVSGRLAGSEALGGRGTGTYSYSEKVQGCLGFLYGAIREQRRDMKKGEQPSHEAVLMDF